MPNMLDTIAYIPTVLAYAFMMLLIFILCFIVLYVSHKIFISVFESLPVTNSMSVFALSEQILNPAEHKTFRNPTVIKANPQDFQTSIMRSRPKTGEAVITINTPGILFVLTNKTLFSMNHEHSTALRIIVTLEPCYLAFVVFAYECGPEGDFPPCMHSDKIKYNKLIKYFDSLCNIPMGRIMEKCGSPEDELESQPATSTQKRMPLAPDNNKIMLQNLIDDMVNNTFKRRTSKK